MLTMQNLILTVDLVNAILQYLSGKPFSEVNQLIGAIQQEAQAQAAASAEAPAEAPAQ